MADYPIKWVPIGDEERRAKLRVFKEPSSKEVDMMMSIPAGIRLPSNFVKRNFPERIYNMTLRPDDIWIVTFPKCGTTVRVREKWTCTQDSIKFLFHSGHKRLCGRLSTTLTWRRSRRSSARRGCPSWRLGDSGVIIHM